jgi:hypothetical protein
MKKLTQIINTILILTNLTYVATIFAENQSSKQISSSENNMVAEKDYKGDYSFKGFQINVKPDSLNIVKDSDGKILSQEWKMKDGKLTATYLYDSQNQLKNEIAILATKGPKIYKVVNINGKKENIYLKPTSDNIMAAIMGPYNYDSGVEFNQKIFSTFEKGNMIEQRNIYDFERNGSYELQTIEENFFDSNSKLAQQTYGEDLNNDGTNEKYASFKYDKKGNLIEQYGFISGIARDLVSDPKDFRELTITEYDSTNTVIDEKKFKDENGDGVWDK